MGLGSLRSFNKLNKKNKEKLLAHAAHTLEYRRHPCFLDSVCNTFDDQKKQLPSILTEHMQVSKEVRVRRPTVVRQRLDFFSPLLSSLFPSKKHVNPAKIKGCPLFSSYFNCEPYSFDCSLFVLNYFFSISSFSILLYFVFISNLVLILFIF